MLPFLGQGRLTGNGMLLVVRCLPGEKNDRLYPTIPMPGTDQCWIVLYKLRNQLFSIHPNPTQVLAVQSKQAEDLHLDLNHGVLFRQTLYIFHPT